jgi:hypothetical protein
MDLRTKAKVNFFEFYQVVEGLRIAEEQPVRLDLTLPGCSS